MNVTLIKYQQVTVAVVQMIPSDSPHNVLQNWLNAQGLKPDNFSADSAYVITHQELMQNLTPYCLQGFAENI